MDETKLFSTQEAAGYVGVSLRTLKYYVYNKKMIEPLTVGHSLVFTKAMLDDLKVKLHGEGLTIEEAAAHLNVDERWIRSQVFETGRLKPSGNKRGKSHLFTLASVEALRPYIRESTSKRQLVTDSTVE